MCLRIAGRILALHGAERKLAAAGVAGIKREVKLLCITGARTIGGFLGDRERPRDRRAAYAA